MLGEFLRMQKFYRSALSVKISLQNKLEEDICKDFKHASHFPKYNQSPGIGKKKKKL
jgi:hypothetical protein